MLLVNKDMPPLPQLRQRLWADFRRLARLLRQLQRPQPMCPGSLYRLRTKCGKPSCHCAHGEPHAAWVLTRSELGQSKLYSVPAAQRPRLKRLTAEYRRFQRARARWVKLTGQLLRQVDAIEQARVQRWPTPPARPARPAPPRKPRKQP